MALPDEYHQTLFRLEGAPDPLPGAFAIITAWNPMGRSAPIVENESADRALHTCLGEMTGTLFRATGGSPDFTHAEPGWAAAISRDEAIRIGRLYRQLAVWWIEGDDLHLVDSGSGASEPVGPFRARIV